MSAVFNWICSPDGDDYCPQCWEKLLKSVSNPELITMDATPVNELLKYRNGVVVCANCFRVVNICPKANKIPSPL